MSNEKSIRKVKRYDLISKGPLGINEDKDGNWVYYEDHKLIEYTLTTVTAERDRYKDAINNALLCSEVEIRRILQGVLSQSEKGENGNE